MCYVVSCKSFLVEYYVSIFFPSKESFLQACQQLQVAQFLPIFKPEPTWPDFFLTLCNVFSVIKSCTCSAEVLCPHLLFTVGSGSWYLEVWKSSAAKRLTCALMNESGSTVMAHVVYLKWTSLGAANLTLCCIPVVFFKLIIVNVQNVVKGKDTIGYRPIICHFTSSRVIYMLITVCLAHMLS